jgi:hypothetical protein
MGLQLGIAIVIKGAEPPAEGNGNGWNVQYARRSCHARTEGEEINMALHDSGCMNCKYYLLQCVIPTFMNLTSSQPLQSSLQLSNFVLAIPLFSINIQPITPDLQVGAHLPPPWHNILIRSFSPIASKYSRHYTSSHHPIRCFIPSSQSHVYHVGHYKGEARKSRG